MLEIKNNKGISILEFVISVGILVIFLPALVTVFVIFYRTSPNQSNKLQALALLREQEDGLRSLYLAGWSNVNVSKSSTYFVCRLNSGATWYLTDYANTKCNNDLVNGTNDNNPRLMNNVQFTRQITISNVNRKNDPNSFTDGSNGSVSGLTPTPGNGITTDASSLQFRITVTWPSQYSSASTSSVSTILYLTNYQGNNSTFQTASTFSGSGCSTNSSGIYNSSGSICTYTSNSIALSSNATINNIVWTQSNTDQFKFQIALSSTSDNGGNPWSFVGPDGTSGSYFIYSNVGTPSFGMVNLNSTGSYAEYKIIIPANESGYVSSISINYTP